MTVLALETSAQAASCAIARDGRLVGECYANAGLTHSQTVMPMVEAMLNNTRIILSEVDFFAVSTGPGSFTGLRIGLSAIKGMAMAAGKPCVGISTLRGLAENLSGTRTYIVPALDARRSQVYTAIFDNRDSAMLRLREDEAVAIDELGARLGKLEGEIVLIGDGARLCLEALGHMPGLSIAPEHLLYQRAASVALLAERLYPEGAVSAGELAPTYLRLPQAERELRERGNT
jgi:tRNA threonylcarbamoyladenosine biosynthesis protein TsaB